MNSQANQPVEPTLEAGSMPVQHAGNSAGTTPRGTYRSSDDVPGWTEPADRPHPADAYQPWPESDELLRMVVENLPNGVAFVVDCNLRYRLAGGAVLGQMGLTSADFEGKSLVEVLGPELSRQYEPPCRQALGGQPFTLEHDFHGRSLRTHGRPLRDRTGVLYALLVVAYDETERKQTEDMLRGLDERTRIAIEAAEMGTWEWNLETDEVYWNKQHYRLFGLDPRPETPDDGIGLTAQPPMGSAEFMRHVHPDDLAEVRARLERTIQDRVVYQAEFRTVRADGTTHWMSGYGRITGEAGGQATRLSGVMYDIDERKRAEDALRMADQRKDEFLAMLAHELRNPLAPICNGLQVLHLTSETYPMIGPAVAMIDRQTEHLVRLVDDLLDVSRISRGKIELRQQRLNLTELVGQATDAVRPLYQSTNRHLLVSLPPAPVYVNGDATRLTQVVTNLLTNGARYTRAGGQVRLSLEAVGEQALLRVADDGIGIAPDQLEAIFELFVQADTSLARSQGGLGLGLTLVRKLVELHGGRVEAHSRGLDQGSEFLVTLPTLPPSAPTPTPKTQPTGAAGHRLLVVDDNRDAADTLAMLLTLKKYEVHVRYGGREAVEAAQQLQPDILIMDIGMPEMDGYEACRRIREQPWGRAMTLIALTGYGQEADKQRSREAGFDAHLVKPVDMSALMGLLASLPSTP